MATLLRVSRVSGGRTGWTVRGSNFRGVGVGPVPVENGPGAHPASRQWVPGLFPWGKAAGA